MQCLYDLGDCTGRKGWKTERGQKWKWSGPGPDHEGMVCKLQSLDSASVFGQPVKALFMFQSFLDTLEHPDPLTLEVKDSKMNPYKGRGLSFSLFALFRTHCRVNKYNISNKIIFSQSVHLLIYQLICVCDLWLLTVNDHQYKGQTGLAWAAKRHKQVPQPFTGCINMNKCSKRNKKKKKNDVFFKPQ